MKVSNTSERLKQILKERNMKQVDILNLCQPYCEQYNVKINKSHISQWINGVFQPTQSNLTILAKALGVSETWLMGFDDTNVIDSLNGDLDGELILMNEETKKYALKLYHLPETKQNLVKAMIDQLSEEWG